MKPSELIEELIMIVIMCITGIFVFKYIFPLMLDFIASLCI